MTGRLATAGVVAATALALVLPVGSGGGGATTLPGRTAAAPGDTAAPGGTQATTVTTPDGGTAEARLVGDRAGAGEGRADDRDHAVIRPGETLWDLAVRRTGGGQDPRAYVHRLRELNGLDGGPVPAWTVVLLPPR